MPLRGKIWIYCFCKNSGFPSNLCVFEFSYHGNWDLAEIWVLNHFSKTRLSGNFWRLGSYLSEDNFCLQQFKNSLSLLNVKCCKICAKGNWSRFIWRLELEKFTSKIIPLFFSLFLLWEVLNSCIFRNK